MLLLIYTGCRSAEIVDIQNRKVHRKAGGKSTGQKQEDDRDNWDSRYESMDEPGDKDPVYENPDLWTNPNDTDYDDIDVDDTDNLIRAYKALCYKDVCLWVVQNPTSGGHDLLSIEITLSHHKGADRKPKLYVFNLYSLLY